VGNEAPFREMHLVGIAHGYNDKPLSGGGIVAGVHWLIGRVSPKSFPENLKR
jgi:hypothetical protein